METTTVDDLIELILSTARLDVSLEAETPILSSGLIDSFDVVTLLAALDQYYGVAIPPEDVDVEHFDTPAQMLSQIESRRG
jgi:D-alanine--poly(phosphoribitol) ligase subunit 2